MNSEETKIIHATSTSGPALSICGYCRRVVGRTTVLLSIPAPHRIDGEGQQKTPEILSVPFEPIEYCKCMEMMLKGAKYEQH